MATSTKFGIVAALERELRPMTRRCARIRTTSDFAFFEFSDAVVMFGGIGKAAAARASETLVNDYQPAALVSAGFAGAVRPELKVGDLLAASEVLDVESGRKFPTSGGNGVLATITQIADREQKRLLAACGVLAVDMEAAAVALTAQKHALHFLAVKVISDDAEFEMPPMQRFLSQGKFRTASFLAHVAVRPAMWPKVRRLAANSARAAFALSKALDTLLREGTIGKTQIGDTVRVDT